MTRSHCISALMHHGPYASRPYPTLAIDGQPLSQWLTAATADEDLHGLVPAQGWLIDEADGAMAWRRLEPCPEGASAIVPLLICPDDVDLKCTVVAVEQAVADGRVIWRRFGLALQPDVATVQWFAQAGTPLSFEQAEFQRALDELRALIDHAWS